VEERHAIDRYLGAGSIDALPDYLKPKIEDRK
jgi:hypothetical protein